MSMNVYTCTEFPGHYPLGVAAVIVAEDDAGFPSATLASIGEMILINTTVRSVNILGDGDY